MLERLEGKAESALGQRNATAHMHRLYDDVVEAVMGRCCYLPLLCLRLCQCASVGLHAEVCLHVKRPLLFNRAREMFPEVDVSFSGGPALPELTPPK